MRGHASCTGVELCDPDANDPRITRAGDFLRGWQMDELPQLLSVMRDEMSLVGLSN